jgi:hypothetical protein
MNSLDFLRAVYNNVQLPLSVRMRAAGMAIAYEFPKLAVTAILPPEQDFAARLEQRVRHTRQMKLIEAKPVEEGTKPKTDLTVPPPTIDRRFRRRV